MEIKTSMFHKAGQKLKKVTMKKLRRKKYSAKSACKLNVTVSRNSTLSKKIKR